MLQKYNKWAVLQVFFNNPIPKGNGFQLREISRKIGLAPVSIKKYLDELIKEGFVIKTKHRIHKYPIYWANRDNQQFRFFKKINSLININDSGLLEYLTDTCMPDAIILFGSVAKGEDVEESDLDLFVTSKEKKLNLSVFEAVLGKKINIFFKEKFSDLSQELKNNIINGIFLKGYLKVF